MSQHCPCLFRATYVHKGQPAKVYDSEKNRFKYALLFDEHRISDSKEMSKVFQHAGCNHLQTRSQSLRVLLQRTKVSIRLLLILLSLSTNGSKKSAPYGLDFEPSNSPHLYVTVVWLLRYRILFPREFFFFANIPSHHNSAFRTNKNTPLRSYQLFGVGRKPSPEILPSIFFLVIYLWLLSRASTRSSSNRWLKTFHFFHFLHFPYHLLVVIPLCY